MKFKISEKEVIRRKYIVPIQMSMPILFLLGLAWIQEKSQEEFFLVMKIFGVILIVMLTVNWIFTKKFVKFSETHELRINSLGIVFSDNLGKNTVSWNIITKVIINEKNKKIKKIFLELDNGTLIQLSIYENLDLLNLELKKYLNEDVWK